MDLVLPALVTIVSLAIVAQHAWAGKGHFASVTLPRGATLLMVAVVTTSLAYVLLTWRLPAMVPAMIAALVIEFASLVLFWLAIAASRKARLLLAFDANLPHSIVQTGPYRVVRHPFYTSYIVFWIGWAIGTWSLWAVPPLVLMIAIYVLAARGEEAKFAATALAADYQQYRRQAGMFWPRLTR
ncbi:MAG: isoprenylcysteine carboxylmethyltransferase family protein [Devosia nanyangense]|uniref:Isoprenylcysteine carboxylmethyltransferase family protein n=1 Tax=Devosia nanyangense TaxID=1228055 RepID=A0A933NXE7_9HYPH|nr:isoprenylcysteine carboxylmethyltransferase family protein [Devosia nanyangense]